MVMGVGTARGGGGGDGGGLLALPLSEERTNNIPAKCIVKPTLLNVGEKS